MILVLRDTTDINILNAHSSTRIVVLPPEKRRLQRRQLLIFTRVNYSKGQQRAARVKDLLILAVVIL